MPRKVYFSFCSNIWLIMVRKSISNFNFFQKAPFLAVLNFAASQTQKRQILKCPIMIFLIFLYAQKGVFQFFQIFGLFWSESPFQNSIFFKKHHFWTVRNFAASQTQKRQILKCPIMIFIIFLYAQKGVFQFFFKYLAYLGQKVHFKIQFFSKSTIFGLFAILPRLKLKNGKS